MTDRIGDYDVLTGWEKRVAVDFGSIGPNHVRWNHWTWKERDIVARKVHESAGISKLHGPRSRRMEAWAAENEPIMIGFARDHGPMPDWAHAEYRQSGVPEYVQVVWKRVRPDDPASHGDWAYDPPGPWSDPGKEPAWSSRPKEQGYDPNAAFAAAQAMPEGFTVNEMVWNDDGRLLLPVTDIVYPAHQDELLCMVESKDPTRGGWVTMSALAALGSGADYTETVRDATEINFVVPLSYHIQKHPEAVFKLYFRRANGGAQRPDYMEYAMAVPEAPGVDTQEEGPVGLPQGDGMHARYGGLITYRVAANGDHIANDGTVISTAESRAKEDVPDWRKFELRRLDDVDGIILPGPNALPQDEERFGGNRRFSKRYQAPPQAAPARPAANPDRIMPTDPNYTPLEKALSWAAETHHGEQHRSRWRCAAAALGATPAQLVEVGGDGTAIPMTLQGALKWWEQFGRNARWSMLIEALEEDKPEIAEGDPDIVAANRYREAVGLPPVEKSQSQKLREALTEVNERDDVVVKEFNPATGKLEEIRVSEEEKRRREMDFYHNGPPMQGHFTVEEWRRMNGSEPIVVFIEGWGRLGIFDPAVQQPNYFLEGEGVPTETWRHSKETGWSKVLAERPGYEVTERAAPQTPRTATLREVYQQERAGGWENAVRDPSFGWCADLPGGELVRYPDIMQPDDSVPKPPGVHLWTPAVWLEEMHMKPAGFVGDFEGFLRHYESGGASTHEPLPRARPTLRAQPAMPAKPAPDLPPPEAPAAPAPVTPPPDITAAIMTAIMSGDLETALRLLMEQKAAAGQ